MRQEIVDALCNDTSAFRWLREAVERFREETCIYTKGIEICA